MKQIIEFLRSREDIKVSTLEKALGLANATIKLSKGYIIPKHVDVVREYLVKHYGYNEDGVEVVKHEDNVPGDEKKVVKIYNVGRIPGFSDGLLRFQDSIGLWRRVENYGMKKVKAKGHDGKDREVMVLSEDWEAQTGEMCVDVVGKFYIANNGRKIYVEFNKAKK